MNNSFSIDDVYINRIGHRLELFKRKGSYKYNFRCPVCGDSKKNKHLARGYFFRYKGSMLMKCWNCQTPDLGGDGGSIQFSTFLKWFDPELYKDYIFDLFGKKEKKVKDVEEMPVKSMTVSGFEFEKSLKKASKIPISRKCLIDRKIPKERWVDFFYVEKFKVWVNEWKTDEEGKPKFSESSLKHDGPRLVMFCKDVSGKIYALTGRALDDDKLRYILIKVDDNTQPGFGLNRVEYNKPLYICEGPIDSCFVNNCIASMNSSLTLPPDFHHEEVVRIWDNEPRNKEIMKVMGKAVRRGDPVFIWPNKYHAKDLNELAIETGYDRDEITKLISDNTFRGLDAELEFDNWRKV